MNGCLSVNVKSLIDDWQSATVDNFIVQTNEIYVYTGELAPGYYNTGLVKRYNAQTGDFSCGLFYDGRFSANSVDVYYVKFGS